MKKKELVSMREKTKKELEALIVTRQQKLVKFRLETKTGKKKNIALVTLKQRDLAVLKTILKEKELNETV